MLKKNRTVLFIEWSTNGRDFEIALPLMYFFERYLGWKVIYASIFNLPKLLSTNPHLIIMSNTTGATENLKMSRLIEQSGIPLYSHISEGMFRESDIEEFVWGWNKSEKCFSEISSGVWSKKSFNMAVKHYPTLSDFYHVTGAIGFDKYSIYSTGDIDRGKYNKVIGYAAFDFNNIKNKKDSFIITRGKEFYEKVMKKSDEINDILKFIIEKNQDVLFVLKSHPGDGLKEPLEFRGLKDFNNVKFVGSDFGIVNAISCSDIWLNYNSTTNLEAWLLNKPTISFNTDEELFSSEILFGSITDSKKLNIQKYIEDFYRNGKIAEFESKEKLRKQLISDYIGFSDGMNHIRFVSFLKKQIDLIERDEVEAGSWKISVNARIKGYLRHMLFIFAKSFPRVRFLKRWNRPYTIFDIKDFEKRKEVLYKDFDAFYDNNNTKINSLYNRWCYDWKDDLDIK